MGISEADKYLAEHSHIERIPNGAPLIVSGVGTRPKIDDAFRDKLKEIKKKNPRNKIDTY